MARSHQLLVVQPNSAALVYASNQKPGCFTGLFQPGPAKQHFNFLEFIKTQALPGPGSFVNCVVQNYGPHGPTSFYTIEKSTPLSQIPALNYTHEMIAPLPRPLTWDERPLTNAMEHAIHLHKRCFTDYNPRSPETEDQILDMMVPQLESVYIVCIPN